MGTLLAQAGCYHCGECLQPVEFEWVQPEPGNPWANSQLRRDGSAVCACKNTKCERNGLRLKVKLQTIEVEELHDA